MTRLRSALTEAIAGSGLASYEINEQGPGTILADFETLLGFVGGGLKTAGKHHMLPMACLRDLDERMARPLRPNLDRPQQRSFPHLNGLYLLLRTTGLGVVTKDRLELDPRVHSQWLELNPTERYFMLLEAWWRRGAWHVVGLRDSRSAAVASHTAHRVWQMLMYAGKPSPTGDFRRNWLVGCEAACSLALFELFGFATVRMVGTCGCELGKNDARGSHAACKTAK